MEPSVNKTTMYKTLQTRVPKFLNSPKANKKIITALSVTTPKETFHGNTACNEVGFVHINKAGGTSILSTLRKHAESGMVSKKSRSSQTAQFWFHASAARQAKEVGLSEWDSAYTFAVVRNPWARHFSMFLYLVEGPCRHPFAPPPMCKIRYVPQKGKWLQDPEDVAEKFQLWVETLHRAYPVGSSREYLFGSMPHGNNVEPGFGASQLSWLLPPSHYMPSFGVPEKLFVDKVIKLEEIDSMWPLIRQEFCGGTETPEVLPHFNARKDRDKRALRTSDSYPYSWYYNNATAKIVAEHMAADISYFSYSFDIS